MKREGIVFIASIAIAAGLTGAGSTTSAAQTKGGVLKFVVPAEPPSFDGHKETTFALIHPIAPFYSVLIRVDPDNPASFTDFVCDLCTEMPKPTDDGKTYTFKIRKGVKFHDGSPLSAQDVHASFQRIIFPPKGISSARQSQYPMVESVTAPDDETVVFKLKYPSGAFIPSLATPYNFIYSKAKLDADPHWYEQNIMGSGPFIFETREAGARITGKRNPNYYYKDKPYLDGSEAIFATKQSLRVQAIRGDRAAIEFRGFPPKSRDDLVNALGDDITVQESDWNCGLTIHPNHEKKPFDDVRVRRALTLAIDRWGGSKDLLEDCHREDGGRYRVPRTSVGCQQGGVAKHCGFWPDIEKSRAEARRLLKEAGVENLKFTILNRAVDQPYTIVGTWLIDQWKTIGVTVEQKNKSTGPWFASLRSGGFEVGMSANCQSIVNPLLDVSTYLSSSRSAQQYARFEDPKLEEYFDAMNSTADVEKQKKLMRQLEKQVLDIGAHNFTTVWWYRIVPHRSYVKGWKVSPSHYLNQDLSGVWIEE